MPDKFDSRALQPDAFRHIDDYQNNFSACAAVCTECLHGDPEQIEAPWISIVIPTYNRSDSLKAALDSALSQQGMASQFEIVVVDNTPFDENGLTPAMQVVRKSGDKRVLYYHNEENLGIGYNWNRGVELSRGKWVCFLHDDDLLCPDALHHVEWQIQRYRGSKPLGYIHARRIDFSGTFLADSEKRFPQERLTRFGVLISGCTGAGSPTCGTAILREAYMSCGGINYDFASSADAVLCYQIMKDYAVVTSMHILGGSRWENNESLKKDTLLQMVQADELLSSYAYKQSAFSAWWGRCFADTSSWRNIYRKQKIADSYGVSIAKNEFAAVTVYKEPDKYKKALFFFIYAVFRTLRYLTAYL